MIKCNLRKKGLIGISLALALCIVGVGAHSLRAAGRVDTEKTVKITATLPDGDNSVFAQEYKGTVEVELYKIAELDEIGEPTLTSKFADAGINLSVLKQSPSVDTVKSEIVAKALAASDGIDPDKTITLDRGQGQTKASVEIEAGAGIYLYVPQDAQDDMYDFTFIPYIIYAPTSDFISFGEGSDEWKYESEFSLKSSEEKRLGNLVITKTLTNFKENLGTVPVVYKVKGVVTINQTEKTVLDKVVTISFDQSGTKTATVEGIAATAVVTVTEDYSGASYSVTGGEENAVRTATITADETSTVEFENEYDGRLITGGISAENNFIEKEDGVIYWIDEEGREIPQNEIAR